MINNELDQSFKDSVSSNEAISIAKDFSEVALDSVMNNGILKDIPIIGTLLSFGKIAYSLKERHTLKKIAIFLSRLSDIPLEERVAFSNKLENDKYNESLSEKIILIIERLDETEKAEIVGNLFNLYIKEAISRERFLRFSSIVERAYLSDLLALHNKHGHFESKTNYHSWSNETQQSLFSLGLLEQFMSEKKSNIAEANGFNATESKLEFKLSSLRSDLANILHYDLSNANFLEYLTYLQENLKGENSFYIPPIKFG